MRFSFGALLLTGALLMPVAVRADDHDRDDRDNKRYYDRGNRDWHNWDSNEDRAYRRYLEERREQYRDWNRANAREQRQYWQWRHSHPDSLLWNNERSRENRDREDRDRDRNRDRDDRR
jgi:hypothetical protein